MHAPVYLDSHATTPVDPRVLEAMLPFFTRDFGNAASSTHAWGWTAQAAVEQARREVGALVGASPREITFTSGATESNNFALRGATRAAAATRRGLVVSAIEHKSVLAPARELEGDGHPLAIVPVGRDGRIDLEAIDRSVSSETAIVSVMLANNEVGVVQPVAEIAAIAHRKGALLHVDAAQAVGKIPVDVAESGIDLLSLTAHKLYGPKGCGAIVIRKGVALAPLIVGGGHERGLRAGTLNVPGIVGLGRACAIAQAEMPAEAARLAALRDRLLSGLREGVGELVVNGSMTDRLPHNLHVSFPHVDGESLMIGIGDIAVSGGSACSSASGEPSHVLAAMLGAAGVPSASVRFGLSRFTTDDEIGYTIEKFVKVVRHLRDMAPV
jgi:cysteine desulfurase